MVGVQVISAGEQIKEAHKKVAQAGGILVTMLVKHQIRKSEIDRVECLLNDAIIILKNLQNNS